MRELQSRLELTKEYATTIEEINQFLWENTIVI